MKTNKEIWKELLIPGVTLAIKYEISSHGNIRKYGVRNKPLSYHVDQKIDWSSGYARVPFRINGNYVKFVVSRLVLTVFVGPPNENQPHCAHIDGNPRNNHLSNLRWSTVKENWSDKMIHGTQPLGEKLYNSVLNNESVLEIRSLYKNGNVTQRSMALRFNVTPQCINLVVKGKNWKHLK